MKLSFFRHVSKEKISPHRCDFVLIKKMLSWVSIRSKDWQLQVLAELDVNQMKRHTALPAAATQPEHQSCRVLHSWKYIDFWHLLSPISWDVNRAIICVLNVAVTYLASQGTFHIQIHMCHLCFAVLGLVFVYFVVWFGLCCWFGLVWDDKRYYLMEATKVQTGQLQRSQHHLA